MLPVVVVEL